MNKLIIGFLLLLGLVEILYGILWGPLRIYIHEAPFAESISLQMLSAHQVRAFNHYIDLFQNQWHVVTFFGAMTMVAAVGLWFTVKRQASLS